MKVKFIHLLYLSILFLSSSCALAATHEDFAIMREEWNREVISNLDKAYTIYVGMTYKELQTNFANAGWNIKNDVLVTGSPAIKLTKDFREIVVWGDSNTEIEGFDIIFYTGNRTEATLIYNDTKKMLEKNYGNLDDTNIKDYASFYDKKKLRGYEISMIDSELSYQQEPRFTPKPEFGKEFQVVFTRKYYLPGIFSKAY